MKVKSTVTIRLESPDGDALITLRPAPLNVQYEMLALKDSEDKQKINDCYMRYQAKVLAGCIAVDCLEYEDGKAITAEDVRTLNIDSVLANAIMAGYHASLNVADKESSEKKDSGPQ